MSGVHFLMYSLEITNIYNYTDYIWCVEVQWNWDERWGDYGAIVVLLETLWQNDQGDAAITSH